MTPRRVLVTGASKGIGAFLVDRFLAAGDLVVGCGRSPHEAPAHERYTYVSADVADEAAVRELFAEARRRLGGLDVLVNNAGIARMNLLALTPFADARRIVDTNLLGTFHCMQQAIRLMRRSPAGRIVNVTTVAVPLRLEGEALYAASKAAVETLTRVAAREVGPLGITCNAVGPSPIRIDLVAGIPPASPMPRVVFNRLFEILLVGGLFAVASTVVSLVFGGRGLLSNYWPFLLGANVLVNAFPANPTTWYIGTYIHVILLWAWFGRRLRPSVPAVALVACVEIAVRALLWSEAGSFVAYMLVPNWLTCLLLGTYAGQRTGPRESGSAAVAVVALAAPLVFGVLVPFDQGFPFRALSAAGGPGRLVASAGVTLLYAGGAWLMYRCASRLPRLSVVEFLAKQTVFIFVSHMPVFYWLMTFMGDWPRPLRAVPLVVICYVGLALLGALFYRALRPVMLREAIGRRLPWPA